MGIFVNLSKWQNYAHYILDGTILFFMLYFGLFPLNILGLVSFIFALFVVDTIWHIVFYVLPEPFQWRD